MPNGRTALVSSQSWASVAESGEAERILGEVRSAKRRRSVRERRRALVVRVTSLVIVFVAWQLYGMHTIPILFDPISTVVHDGYNLFADGTLGPALGYSMWTFAMGYVIGGVVGVVVGLLLGAYRYVEAAASMYVYALYATPMVALVPIISLWIGFSATAQVVIISLFVVWPMTVTVYHGVRNIDPELMEVARSIRLNRRQTWIHVLLPGSVPFVITGARQGIAMALVGMIIAEIQTELTGIGRVLESESSTYHTAAALSVVLLIMVLGVVLRTLLVLAQRYLIPWMRMERGGRKR
jgi:NitT/TauT family transport system permease protein